MSACPYLSQSGNTDGSEISVRTWRDSWSVRAYPFTLLMLFNLQGRSSVALRVRVLRTLMPARPHDSMTQRPTGNRLSVYWHKAMKCHNCLRPVCPKKIAAAFDSGFVKSGCTTRRANTIKCSLRGSTHKLGTIQRRLAWPLHKDDTL